MGVVLIFASNFRFLLSPRIISADAKLLNTLIISLNELYKKLYGNFKPKFHFLTHYPRVLLNNGPIVNFWSMRFESNQRPLKSAAQISSNSKNLLKTIAIKQALKMCQMMNSKEFEDIISFVVVNNIKKRGYFNGQVNIRGTVYELGSFITIFVIL